MARFDLFQIVEDVRGQHIAAHDGHAGRRILAFGLFHHVAHTVHAGRHFLAIDDAVTAHLFPRHFHDADDGHLFGHGHFDEPTDTGHAAEHQVVAHHDGKGFVAHQLTRAQHGMAQTQLALLAHGKDVDHLRHLAHFLQLVQLAGTLQQVFELQVVVEVVFDDVLVTVGDEDHVLDMGTLGLFHNILDDRLVVDGQHFLGNILGRGQGTGPPAGHRDNNLTNILHVLLHHGTPVRARAWDMVLDESMSRVCPRQLPERISSSGKRTKTSEVRGSPHRPDRARSGRPCLHLRPRP